MPNYERLSSKLTAWKNSDGQITDIWFYCPGCKNNHPYSLIARHPGAPTWQWNGNVEKPTFTPSLRLMGAGGITECHLFITDGMIQYQGDCAHALSGQTVELPDIE